MTDKYKLSADLVKSALSPREFYDHELPGAKLKNWDGMMVAYAHSTQIPRPVHSV